MDSVFFYHIEEDELANFKRAITQHTALAARRVFYPGPFCRHASVHFHVDVAVLVLSQADDRSHCRLHSRSGLLHHWLQAAVWLWALGNLVAPGFRLYFCLLLRVIAGAFRVLFRAYPRHSSDGIQFASQKLHDRLLYLHRSPDLVHGLPYQSPRQPLRHPQNPTTRRLKACRTPSKRNQGTVYQ